MLMALANADRCFDLAGLDLSFLPNRVKFIIPGVTKTRRCGPPIEVFYPEFNDNPRLCLVKSLSVYEQRTQSLRPSPQQGVCRRNPLFLSVQKQHRPVSPATLRRRWLKTSMKDAGIDTSTFSTHSTRSVTTSKVGVSLADIVKAANWNSGSTFSWFYNRLVIWGQFSRTFSARSHSSSGDL